MGMKHRINKILEIMAEFNEVNDDCDYCPFHDEWCEGSGDKPCLVEDLTNIVRIVATKGVLDDENA